MISISKHLSEGIDVRLDTRIGSVLQTGMRWSLLDETERSPAPGGFDAMVLAMPSAQAAQLAGVPATLVQHLRMVEWRPCWAALLTLQVASGLHATANWTVTHLNMPSDDVASLLAQALAERFNFGFRPAYVAAHRWLYATPVRPLLERYLWDAKLRIGAVGDWCQGPRLEGAFLSGDALGAAITP